MALFTDFINDLGLPVDDVIDGLLDILGEIKGQLSNLGNQIGSQLSVRIKFDEFKNLTTGISDAVKLNGPLAVQEAVMQRLNGVNNSFFNLSTGNLFRNAFACYYWSRRRRD